MPRSLPRAGFVAFDSRSCTATSLRSPATVIGCRSARSIPPSSAYDMVACMYGRGLADLNFPEDA